MTNEEITLAEQTTDRELRWKLWRRCLAAAYRWEAWKRYGRKGQ
jgi:hypothetical protein